MARARLARRALCAASLPPEPRRRRDGGRLVGGRDCRRDRPVQHRERGLAESLSVLRQPSDCRDRRARQGQAAGAGDHGATARRPSEERGPGRRLRLEQLGHDAERPGRPGSGTHPVSFSKRSDRVRGSASPRPRFHRGGRAGGRATPAGRRAHLSLLATTLRRAARSRGAHPPFEPRTLHRDWRAAASVLSDGARAPRAHARDVRFEGLMGLLRPSQAGRHATRGRAAIAAALRRVRQRGRRSAFRGRRVRSSGRWRRDNGRQPMSRPCC